MSNEHTLNLLLTEKTKSKLEGLREAQRLTSDQTSFERIQKQLIEYTREAMQDKNIMPDAWSWLPASVTTPATYQNEQEAT